MKNYENKDVSVNQGTWKVEGLVNMIQNLVNQIVIALNNKTKSKQDNIGMAERTLFASFRRKNDKNIGQTKRGHLVDYNFTFRINESILEVFICEFAGAPSCLTDEIVSLMINLRVYGGISNEFQFVIYAFGIENGLRDVSLVSPEDWGGLDGIWYERYIKEAKKF
ncbi:20198_t:CDS:2 [Entrophospora sp. SA101]|nr:20198_t:CDS:2 [Entrophospora sp. SA101]